MKDSLGTISAIVTMVTSMMGTGINFMPFAFQNVGYVRGIILINIVGLLTFFSLYIISIAARMYKDGVPTYSLLAAHISKYLKILVDVSTFASCFGSNIFFYRYLVGLVQKLIVSFFGYADISSEMGRKMIAAGMFVPFCALSLKKNLSNLKVSSYITVISVSYLALMMVGYCMFIGDVCSEEPIKMHGSNFSSGISYFILALACQANMVKTYTELEVRTISSIVKVTLAASLFGTLIYGTVGLCGYIVFGDTIKGSVIDLLIDPNSNINVYLQNHTVDSYGISSKAACLGAIMVLFGAFPMQMNPMCEILLSYIVKDNANADMLWKKVIYIVMAVFLVLALMKDLNIDTILQFVSITAINLTSFTYPSIYYLFAKKKMNVTTILAGLMGIGSIASMVYMTLDIL
ncbi:transmembrane aminoacid transporter protein [Ordospora pajunii]|uniref:transmembrane aminoacid transporter protein n=1 Tax=Ordospora pajunii TaxID=3039483 RepID=UPI0029527130|nr:transmembrane aminoacid transporter protein [Ordospora pajunii]KAH9411578.1 transmembrane aminoacid transporter protein [Ordospora pajunii]